MVKSLVGKVEVYEETSGMYADKYTVVIKRGVDSFDVYGMSENPFYVTGVNMFDGNYKKDDIKRMIKNLNAKKVKVIPKDIIRAIRERM